MSTISMPATLQDLSHVTGKAELIAGRIVEFMPGGKTHARISKRILLSLDAYVQSLGVGEAFGDNLGYVQTTPLTSGRQSFCPDVSYFAGIDEGNPLGFITAPPTLAVEVRSQFDYGRAAEAAMAEKRADYFEAGTLVVWDVDPDAQTIAVYRATAPDVAQRFQVPDQADAEPAVPGWRLALREIFAP